MSTPGTELLIDEEESLEGPAPLAPSLWAPRLAVAGRSFIAVGVLIVLGVVITNPLQNLEVLCSGVTLVVAGAVLRSIATPVAPRSTQCG